MVEIYVTQILLKMLKSNVGGIEPMPVHDDTLHKLPLSSDYCKDMQIWILALLCDPQKPLVQIEIILIPLITCLANDFSSSRRV